MENILFDLRLFAEGDGGEGTDAGDISADAGQSELLKLGVPADKLKKRNAASTLPEGTVSTLPPPGERGRLSWEEIMSDPEYNRKMQGVVQSRLKKIKDAEETLTALKPALDSLAKRCGLPEGSTDYKALAKAAAGEAKTEEPQSSGTEQNDEEKSLQQVREHIAGLARQGEALKAVFPGFDLKSELRNPVFARMTAPGVGLSVEDAYYAVHHREIQTAAMQVTAQKAAEKLSNSIRSGSMRPREAGSASQAPSSLSFDYRNASPAQRDALKKRIRDAAARGEKLYPGRGK